MANDFKLRLSDNYNRNDVYGRYSSLVEACDMGVKPAGKWPLEMGIVQTVDIDKHVCRVHTDSGRDIKEVSWLSPWFSFSNAGGMYIMPEPHSRVMVGKVDNGDWYIMGFTPLPGREESYSAVNGRRPIQEGDVVLNTAYGNFIELRKFGESITIHNNETSSIVMNSADDRTVIRSQRLNIFNNAGTITMTSETPEQGGHCRTTGYFRRKVDDNENFVKIDIGYLEDTNRENYVIKTENGQDYKDYPELILNVNVCNKASLSVDTEGNVKIYANTVSYKVEEQFDRFCNGLIADRSATDIEHKKESRSKLSVSKPVDVAKLESYAPSVGAPAAPSVPQPESGPSPSPVPDKGFAPAPDPGPQTPAEPPPPDGGPVIVCRTSSPHGNGSIGTMTLFDSDRNVVGTYQYKSGSTKLYAAPPGVYAVSSPRLRSDKGFAVKDGDGAYGFSFNISDKYDPKKGAQRTELRIHPDGNPPGTAGCFGIQGGADTQKDCYAKIKQLLDSNGGKVRLEHDS